MAQLHLVDDSTALGNLPIVMILFGLSLLVFAIRICTRVYPKYKLDASDYTLSIAVIFAILAHSFFAVTVAKGLGRRTRFISPNDAVTILLHMFMIQLAWLYATCFARLSVACMLLPLAVSRAWKLALKAVIGVQILILVANSSYHFAKCRPLHSAWENVPDRICVGEPVRFSVTILVLSVSLVGDLAVAIMPVFIIWRLNRSWVEKCLISGLMMLGLVAAATEVVKLVHSRTFRFASQDVFRTIVPLFFWSRLEESTLLLSACAPLLKAPIEEVLHRLGLRTFQNSERELNTYHSQQGIDEGSLSTLGSSKT